MDWIIFSLIGIFIAGFSDIFRKIASGLKDPFFTNLVFQSGAFTAGILLYLFFSRKVENNPRDIIFAVLGGMTISVFSFFSFKALATGPGVSVVMPVMRIGGVAVVTLLGVILLKEKLSPQTFAGLILSSIGIYLIFSNK